MNAPRVLVLGTLDTKAQELEYLCDALVRDGMDPLVLDMGQPGVATRLARVTPEEIARTADVSDTASLPKIDRMRVLASGAIIIAQRMIAAGHVHGVIGVGGGQGTWLALEVMESLPLGLPKVMVTTALKRVSERTGLTDVMVFSSVVDIAGLNRILRGVLDNAAAAVAGMARTTTSRVTREAQGGVVGLTMFGVTTPGATAARRHLEAAGLEVATFHANGAGGRALERLVDAGEVIGVLDFTITELLDEVAGGRATAGPDRLEAAGRQGIPQVIVPGAIDVVNLTPFQAVSPAIAHRRLYQHTPTTTLMRSSVQENRLLARVVAEKLSAARGTVEVLVPELGFSDLDRADGVFADEDADAVFVEVLEAALPSRVRLETVPLHINSPDFGRLAADRLIELMRSSGTPQTAMTTGGQHGL